MQAASGVRRISEINITPLIDIVLVLLIVFIVLVPMAARAHQAILPSAGVPAITDLPPPTVKLNADGQCSMDGRVVTRDELIAAVRERVKIQPVDVRRVILRVDGGLPMQRVTEVMDDLKLAANLAEQENRLDPTFAGLKFKPLKIAMAKKI